MMVRSRLLLVKMLDAVFAASAAAAAALLVLVGLTVGGQMVARALGTTIPSADDLAAFSMASSVFLGLAWTYRTGGHIHVSLITDRLPGRVRPSVTLAGGLAMLAIAGHLAWFSVHLAIESYRIDDVTNGVLAVPLWIPQLSMAAGSVLLWVAVAERLLRPRAATALSDAYSAAPE